MHPTCLFCCGTATRLRSFGGKGIMELRPGAVMRYLNRDERRWGECRIHSLLPGSKSEKFNRAATNFLLVSLGTFCSRNKLFGIIPSGQALQKAVHMSSSEAGSDLITMSQERFRFNQLHSLELRKVPFCILWVQSCSTSMGERFIIYGEGSVLVTYSSEAVFEATISSGRLLQLSRRLLQAAGGRSLVDSEELWPLPADQLQISDKTVNPFDGNALIVRFVHAFQQRALPR
ncbi:hypothetical protein AVEN_193808-1 [Araneus ventricosus]|uniref:Uncharacterized protein n=1 Tax=Araneus ventricosus TaxID=182803 RepID=A0A4Y2WUW4_ARAVE|nr:hypothetical protein AVEN_193808-1 [Araneus ventricosus]